MVRYSPLKISHIGLFSSRIPRQGSLRRDKSATPMLCHALRDRSGRQLPCLTPNPDPNYICDFLPSLNYGHRHKRAASFKCGAFKPDDALYAHVASRRCETEAAPTVMPTATAAAAVIFPCSWFSHVCMTPTARRRACLQNRASFGERAHAMADQNEYPQVASQDNERTLATLVKG